MHILKHTLYGKPPGKNFGLKNWQPFLVVAISQGIHWCPWILGCNTTFKIVFLDELLSFLTSGERRKKLYWKLTWLLRMHVGFHGVLVALYTPKLQAKPTSLWLSLRPTGDKKDEMKKGTDSRVHHFVLNGQKGGSKNWSLYMMGPLALISACLWIRGVRGRNKALPRKTEIDSIPTASPILFLD